MLAFLKETLRSRHGSERLLWALALFFVFLIPFSIAASHIVLTATTIVYFYWKWRHSPTFPRAPILIPALAFAYCTLLSAVFSIHPSVSLYDTKNLALFIIIPIFFDAVHDLEDLFRAKGRRVPVFDLAPPA